MEGYWVPILKPAVKSKAQNYRLWTGGFYGNRLRSWRTVEALKASGYTGPVTLRYLGGEGGGPCVYDLPIEMVTTAVINMERQGYDRSRVMFNESAPDKSVMIQGEFWTGMDRPHWMIYSSAKLKMRPAFRGGARTAEGLRTINMLRSHMTASSWADFWELAQDYPDHTIEFSVYSRCIGDTPGRNTLVWEVRSY